LSKVKESLPTLPGNEQARAIALSEILQGELDRLRCVKPEVFLVEMGGTSMEVHPDSYLIITGCSFGIRNGTVSLRLGESGDQHDLVVQNWDENTIVVDVPDIEGVVDQQAFIRVTTFLGKQSDEFLATFIADREVLNLFGLYFASSSTHTEDEHWFRYGTPLCLPTASGGTNREMTVLESIRGFHKQYLDLSPVSGRDTHSVTLINSWHILDGHGETEAMGRTGT
jgi:hypothetical protein